MKILCVTCGHKLDLDDAYDNYEGPVRCWVCGTLSVIRTHEGEICSMQIPSNSGVKREPARIVANEGG
jgi:DNA-directed RNA polymerase subunit RPC12/RpoP